MSFSVKSSPLTLSGESKVNPVNNLPDSSQYKLLRNQIIKLLARRDYSRRELSRKFSTIANQELLNQVFDQLTTEGILKEERFVEVFVRSRIAKGYGPLRIVAELKEKGITEDLISEYIDMSDAIWKDQLQQLIRKKFKGQIAQNLKERAKQMRFLQYRGFSGEQIQKVYKDI